MPEAAMDFSGETGAEQAARITELNERYRHHGATSVLTGALSDPQAGKLSLVSSFGAESVVLLHLISVIKRDTPVLFIDTQMLFAETLAYQSELAERLGLENIQIIRASDAALKREDPDNTLHQFNTDACCDLRKTRPLQEALSGYDGWITGRKRFQGSTRAALEFFEADGPNRIKVNPLAHWAPEDLRAYMDENRLPRHPLVAQGYPSIGCAPCTSKVAPGEDPRAGRWRGQDKNECGIHFVDGKAVRMGGDAPRRDSMGVIVNDSGFAPDDWNRGFEGEDVLDLGPDTNPQEVALAPEPAMIRIDFPSFSDGRGFSIARQLRLRGYQGRLRAKGHVIADQYAMARRSGFDEVEITEEMAKRQPADQWQFRANWRAHDYQSRLRVG